MGKIMARCAPVRSSRRLWLRPHFVARAAVLTGLALVSPDHPAHAASKNAAIEDGKVGEQARRARPAVYAARSDKDRRKNAASDKKGDRPAKVADGKKSARPLFAVVSIGDQRVSIYNHNGLVTRSVVSTGMAGHRTPMGVFTIIGRERFHRSNIYSAAPMPFMQRITWSGVAMHLGVVPGFPASHGCIRLPSRFAAELWGLTKIGERVVIAPRDTAPAAFSHALLPTPTMRPDPMGGSESAALESAIVTGATSQTSSVEKVAADAPTAPIGSEGKLLNPIEYATAYKAKATADALRATKEAKRAFDAASTATAEARRGVAEVKTAEVELAAARAKVAASELAHGKASPDTLAAAQAAKDAANADASAAEAKLNAARAAEAPKTAESFKAVQLWKEAKAAAAAADAEAKEASRRSSPVSVLVSKKDQRVYLRQGLLPLFDAPATIRDPEVPLGTHLYIASAAGEDGASLKWSVISMPVQAGRTEKDREQARNASARKNVPTPPKEPQRAPSNAAEALERIEIPPDAREMISDRLWTGGSLIITDQPLSDETSDSGTDLVVTMR